MEDADRSTPVETTLATPQRPQSRRGALRLFKFGCLALLLMLCGGVGLLSWALQSGPVALQLVGNNTLKLGSDDFVLSNYSFQTGTTYYIDLNGNGVRNILQLNYLEDTHRVELVLHYADKSEQGEHHLGQMALP